MNDIDILNDIMKPYFDKKAQIDGVPKELANTISESKEKLQELRRERLERKKELQIELENLRVRKTVALKNFEENKEKEINDYIKEALNSNSNFYSSYGSMLRKDLERNYDKKLQDLEEEFSIKEEKIITEIKELSTKSEEEKEESQELTNLSNQPNYKNVDLREIVEIKDGIRIKLFAERKRLKAKLEELTPEKQEYEKIVLDLNQKQTELKEYIGKLTNFKYEYNDQNQVINNNEFNELYEKRSIALGEIERLTKVLSEKMDIVHELNAIKKSLEKVEEYIKITELTKEETNSVMMSMTPWEKEEYDRRKGILTSDIISMPAPTTSSTLVKKESSTGEIYENDDMIISKDPVVSKYEIENDKIIVDTKVDLLKAVFNDIISEINGINGIRINPSKEKLGSDEYYLSTKESSSEKYEQSGTVSLYETNEEPMELPNGEYVYYKDMNDALENYYKKNKGQTYAVKSTGKEYHINLGTIIKFKSSLKQCSALKLVKDKKITKLDITRILGKSKTENLFRSQELGSIYGKTNMPEGDYVNRNELIAKLNNLFTTRKLEWLRNLSEDLKTKTTEIIDKFQEKENEEKTRAK